MNALRAVGHPGGLPSPRAQQPRSMVSLDEALASIGDIASPLGIETLPLNVAQNRVLAEPVHARLPSPRCTVSAMDGYAVRDDDLGWLPAVLRVAGASYAGTARAPTLRPGTALRVFTGAPLPPGATRVVMQEDAVRDGNLVSIATVGIGRHVRAAGDDFAQDACLLEPGTIFGPRALVTAAAADQATVHVWRQPRVTMIATGDELADPGTALEREGSVPDSVSLGLAALITESGGVVVGRHRGADTLPALEALAAAAIRTSDLVVVTGGASVGERDYAKAMFAPLALQLLFSKVAIKPGKPVWLGRVGDTFVLGLPGNPTSAMVTARLLLVPLLAGLTGRPPVLDWQMVPASAAFPATGPRETLVRAQSVDGGLAALRNQDSGAQAPLALADWLVRRPAGSPAAAIGDPLCALRF